MLKKIQMKWLYVLAIFFLVFFILFIAIVSALGVPLWWITPKQLAIAGPPSLIVQISPQTPKNFNDQITVTVTNSSDQLPVNGARVLVMTQGMSTITLCTNSTGQVIFPYTEKITVIQSSYSEINSNPIAVPEKPTAWVNSTYTAFGSAALGGFVSGFATWAFQRGKGKTKRNPIGKQRRSKNYPK